MTWLFVFKAIKIDVKVFEETPNSTRLFPVKCDLLDNSWEGSDRSMGSSQSTPNETDTTQVVLESDDDGEVKVGCLFVVLFPAIRLSIVQEFNILHELIQVRWISWIYLRSVYCCQVYWRFKWWSTTTLLVLSPLVTSKFYAQYTTVKTLQISKRHLSREELDNLSAELGQNTVDKNVVIIFSTLIFN